MTSQLNIDDEWSNFVSNMNKCDSDDESVCWSMNDEDETESTGEFGDCNIDSEPPEPTEIYISTKTKIGYLNQPVDLQCFWDIEVMPYCCPKNGVIKKQIYLVSKTPEEIEIVESKLKDVPYYEQHIKTHIDNPGGRIKFKDNRKISIGISQKDIMSHRSKKKQAFRNCFVLFLRIKVNDTFKEFHAKIFNTGKLEIPGVQNEGAFSSVINTIVDLLQPFYTDKLSYNEKSENILINSNFICGFYINREALFEILKNKYNIHAIYDSCSYPGIQCKFYYDNNSTLQTGIMSSLDSLDKNNKIKYDKKKQKNVSKVSFMIFRTGSVLIVGKCDEQMLVEIYNFITTLLKTEFKHICQKIMTPNDYEVKNKKKQRKIRKKTITVLSEDSN